MKLPRKVIFGCALFLVCASALLYWKHKVWPYGMRSCCLPCMMTSMSIYAQEHQGWYPKSGKTPFESLTILTNYGGDGYLLAGISGDENETERRIKLGLPIDETVSSWVYVPGFRNDDPKIAIIWERQGGITFNGHSYDGHAVGYTDGSFYQIPQDHWPDFLKEQELLRQTTLAKRKN
jgi:hypothetical protein